MKRHKRTLKGTLHRRIPHKESSTAMSAQPKRSPGLPQRGVVARSPLMKHRLYSVGVLTTITVVTAVLSAPTKWF